MRISRGIPVSSETAIALTIGNFDGVHLGHQAMLQRLTDAAATLGLPSAVMTFEPHPREFFTPDLAPVRLTSLREKLEMFSRFGIAHVYICRFNEKLAKLGADEFVDQVLHRGLQVKWLLVGDDFRFGAGRMGSFETLQANSGKCGFEVHAMGSVQVEGIRVSSTAVRQALISGELALAQNLLGRPYSMCGRVVDGDKLGRKLGFPTANIVVRHDQSPLNGIFVVNIHGLAAQPLPGVASLGVRPTIGENAKPVLEVHIFDFAKQIYGRRVQVDFLHKLRDEEKYPSLELLTQQIARDVEDARRYFKN